MTEYCSITIPQGPMTGKIVSTPSGNKYYSFEGIPYAKPPVGELRFKAPQKPENWQGNLDATKPSQKSLQLVKKDHIYEGSEDCLYLNIYTAEIPNDSTGHVRNKPVIVFVHGGSFFYGAGHYYRPDYLMDCDVVLVTINYRLGVLGFLCLDTSDVPGNAGIKDVALAFEWIRENIGYFGGDQSNITALGESGGGGIISILTFHETDEDLFDKMILESATSIVDVMLYKEDEVEKAKRFAEKLNHKFVTVEKLSEFLRSCSVDDLMRATLIVDQGEKQFPYAPRPYFMPVIEKYKPNVRHVITKFPEEYYKLGQYRKLPTILGYNSKEAAYFFHESKLTSDLTHFIPINFYMDRKSKEAKRLSEVLKQFYFGNKQVTMETAEEFINIYSDSLFARDIHRYLDVVDKKSVWLYHFSYMGTLSSDFVKKVSLYGACHSDQLNYQFYKKSKSHLVLNENDKRIIRFFALTWTNFAKFGEPRLKETGICSFDWPQVGDDRNCLVIDKQFSTMQYPDKEMADFWRDVYKKHGGRVAKI